MGVPGKLSFHDVLINLSVWLLHALSSSAPIITNI